MRTCLQSDMVGTELLSLEAITTLYPDLYGVRIVTNALSPSDEFQQRYIASDQFAPEPTLVATLTYDTMAYLLNEISLLTQSDNRLTRQILIEAFYKLILWVGIILMPHFMFMSSMNQIY